MSKYVSRGVTSWGPGGGDLRVQLTLFQPGGADYAHHITACPLGFENLTTSLNLVGIRILFCSTTYKIHSLYA